jgi:hypothetical protein
MILRYDRIPMELPPQPAVFAPDYAPEEISEIAAKLRQKAAGSRSKSRSR